MSNVEVTAIAPTTNKPGFWSRIKSIAIATSKSLVTWSWTKHLLHWLIMSAGTMAECAFLVASLWMSINASVHPFVLMFLTEENTKLVSQIATTAYVALPECICGLAVVVTLNRLQMWLANRKDWKEIIWFILYLIPTVVFLVLSVITLANSVANNTFEMPTPWVITRALAGYMFAFISLLYAKLGEPQERDRLAKKDAEIANIRKEMDDKTKGLEAEMQSLMAKWQEENARLQSELSQTKAALLSAETAQSELQKSLNKSAGLALEAYSDDLKNWLSSGIKTANVEEVSRYSGHSKRKLNAAIGSGKLAVSPRNKELILVSSLTEWLKDNPPTSAIEETETGPILRIVNQ